jgi:hypothetical protein
MPAQSAAESKCNLMKFSLPDRARYALPVVLSLERGSATNTDQATPDRSAEIYPPKPPRKRGQKSAIAAGWRALTSKGSRYWNNRGAKKRAPASAGAGPSEFTGEYGLSARLKWTPKILAALPKKSSPKAAFE